MVMTFAGWRKGTSRHALSLCVSGIHLLSGVQRSEPDILSQIDVDQAQQILVLFVQIRVLIGA
jgi:hypothetical protein